MADIDDPIPDWVDSSLVPRLQQRRDRLKKKRARLPGNWEKILSILKDGGYLTQARKTYTLFNKEDRVVGKVFNKTVEELFDSGFLEWKDDSDDSPAVLSDEGRGFLS